MKRRKIAGIILIQSRHIKGNSCMTEIVNAFAFLGSPDSPIPFKRYVLGLSSFPSILMILQGTFMQMIVI